MHILHSIQMPLRAMLAALLAAMLASCGGGSDGPTMIIERDQQLELLPEWKVCAVENEVCYFEGTQTVRYGYDGVYSYGTYTGSAACNNSTFGDPLKYFLKYCEITGTVLPPPPAPEPPPPAGTSWTACAREGEFCSFSGTQLVRYGFDGAYAYGTFTNGVACNNSVFGDPLKYYGKYCDVTPLPLPPEPTGTTWVVCAAENEFCSFPGTHQVRYGLNDTFAYGEFTDGVACNNSVFGDPLPYYGKFCEISVPTPPEPGLTWQSCAADGELCRFKGTRRIRFGLNGFYSYGTFTGNVSCSSSVFGDPVPGLAKTCDVADGPVPAPEPTVWVACADENGFCWFTDTQRVRYGTDGHYVVGTFTDGVACTSEAHGDPLPGAAKVCEVAAPAPPLPVTAWEDCASEGGVCIFSGTRRIRYGFNGFYAYGTFTGSAVCTNEAFGDPMPYITKHCQVEAP
jgi:hypothetical protein